MNLWRSIEGMADIRLVSADPGEILGRINEAGIRLYQVVTEDALSVRFRLLRRDIQGLCLLCEKRGAEVTILERRGLHYTAVGLLRRPVLVGCLALLLGLTAFLPTRVLFFRVEGNETVPARRILAAAEDCGIRFGAARRAVRSEKMKNALLEAMPELKWAGINTAGCTAVISVRERAPETGEPALHGVSSIAAVRDGYITSCTVTRGSGLCAPGQVVKAGQVLISGYTDCGLTIRATRAEGEVYAQTSRDLTALTPDSCSVCRPEGTVRRRYSLILGKKRINFWKDSGISPATCGRMYEEYYLTLPGGFRLPAALAVETLQMREISPAQVPVEDLEEPFQAYARRCLLQQTVAGQILREEQSITASEGIYVLKGRYLCSEMIGRVITEEMGETNGKTD